MSFGFSIGDFLKLVQLAHKTYEYCKNSTVQFKDIGRDVGNAHIILKTIGDFWKAEDERGKELLLDEQEQLKQYSEECEPALRKLEKIVQRYGQIESSTVTRLQFAWKDFLDDFAEIRETLRQCTTNLATFHIILTQEALIRRQQDGEERILKAHQDVASILEVLVRNYVAYQNGEKEEPAYSQLSRGTVVDRSRVYETANEELSQGGIGRSVVEDNQLLVKEWLDVVVLAEAGDDDGWDDLFSIGDVSTPTHEAIQPPVSIQALFPASSRPLSVFIEDGLSAFSDEYKYLNLRAEFTASPESQKMWPSVYLKQLERAIMTHDVAVISSQQHIETVFNEVDWMSSGYVLCGEAEELLSMAIESYSPLIPHQLRATVIANSLGSIMQSKETIDFERFSRAVVNVIRESMVILNHASNLFGLTSAKHSLEHLVSSDKTRFYNNWWTFSENSRTWTHALGGIQETKDLPINLDVNTALWLSEKFCAISPTLRLPPDTPTYIHSKIRAASDIGAFFRHFATNQPEDSNFEHFTSTLDDSTNKICLSPYRMHPKLSEWPLDRVAIFRKKLWGFLIHLLKFHSTLEHFNLENADKRQRNLKFIEIRDLEDFANQIINHLPELEKLTSEYQKLLITEARLAPTLSAFYQGCYQQTKLFNKLQVAGHAKLTKVSQPWLPTGSRFKLEINHIIINLLVPDLYGDKNKYDVEVFIGATKRPFLSASRLYFSDGRQVLDIHGCTIHPDLVDQHQTLQVKLTPSPSRSIKDRTKVIFGRSSDLKAGPAPFIVTWTYFELISGLKDGRTKKEFVGGTVECMLVREKPERAEGVKKRSDESPSESSPSNLEPTIRTAPKFPIPLGWRCIRVPFLDQNTSHRVCFWNVETRRPTLALWQEIVSANESNNLNPYVNEFGFYEPVDMSKVKPLSFTTNYGFMTPITRQETLYAYGKGHLTYKDSEYWL